MLEIAGAWTKAGVASCVRIRGSQKDEDFLFDCGLIEGDALSAKVL